MARPKCTDPEILAQRAAHAKAKKKAWHNKNPERVKFYEANRKPRDREKAKLSTKLWRERNPGRNAASARARYRRLRESILAEQRSPEYRAVARANDAKWRRANAGKQLWKQTKQRARVAGLPFDLIYGDIVVPEFCPVFGLRLETGSGKRVDSSPSIDRIVPAKGYVRENVIVISWLANRLKSNATVPQMQRLAEFYTALRPIGCPAE